MVTVIGCHSTRYIDPDQRSDVALNPPGAEGYRPGEAGLAARLTERAYHVYRWHDDHERGEIDKWDADVFADPSVAHQLDFDPTLLLAKSGPFDEEPEAFGFLARDADTLYIIFRGTQSANNWYENVLFTQERFAPDPERPVLVAGVEPLVHRGFYEIYARLREPLLRQIAGLTVDENGGVAPVERVVIAGHSLGGALATLAALDVARCSAAPDAGIVLYTFGCPRVGDARLAIALDRYGVDAFRFVNSEDSVPDLPPSTLSGSDDDRQLYQHIGRTAVFTAQRGTVPANHDISLYRMFVERNGEPGYPDREGRPDPLTPSPPPTPGP